MEKKNCLLVLVCLVATIYSIDCNDDVAPEQSASIDSPATKNLKQPTPQTPPETTSNGTSTTSSTTTTSKSTTSTSTPTTNSTSRPSTSSTSPSTSTSSTPSPTPSTSTGKPSTSTIKPSSTSTLKPTPTPAPSKPDRGFDVPSFIGGIILALGVLAISYVVYKFYRTRTDPTYRTL